MTTSRIRLLLAGLAATAATLPIVQPAAAKPAPPDVPSTIRPPADEKVFLEGHAIGVQIYTCSATGWGSSVPRANLYDDHGRLIMTHFGGPTWQVTDGSASRVVARRVDGVPAPDAIPWLLLEAVSTTHGRLAHTQHIQRVNTTGGVSPAAADCTAGNIGEVREIPYTADYFFWK